MMEQISRQELPAGMGFEWTELTYQQIKAGEDLLTKLVFPLAVVFVFLVLAAQYESWALPVAIILIVPMCLLAAIAGIWVARMDNNIFTQIGLVVLVGLALQLGQCIGDEEDALTGRQLLGDPDLARRDEVGELVAGGEVAELLVGLGGVAHGEGVD
jgi:hypothetical protein